MCIWGGGLLAKGLRDSGFNVVGNTNEDFFDTKHQYDCIITNPPYSKKYEFLKRCYELKKPFALLMPLSTLEGKKRGELFRRYGIQLIIPNKRINFITPSGKGGGAWFQTAWFTYGLNLQNDLIFTEMERA